MANNLYVSFDDSSHDPTYSFADACLLVEAPESDGNPCTTPARTAPLIPSSAKELRRWAEMLGWTVEESNGQLIVRTSIDPTTTW